MCGSIKKESLDSKPDMVRQTLHEARAKPKLTSTQSESHLTVFANGHHKPCHRNNNTAHVSGAPYKIPRPHTLHGHSEFAALNKDNAYNKPQTPATTRSMDTLSLSNNDFYAMFGSSQRSMDSLPMTTMGGSLDTLGFQDSMFANPNSPFAQDGNSPDSSNASETFPTQQWPWTTNTGTPVNSNFGFGSLSTSPSQDCLPNLDNPWAVPSASFDPLWSAGDLPLDPNKLNDSLAQPISHSGESKQSGPGLTVASSVHSEIGEPTMFSELDYKPAQSATAESTLFWEDSPVYRFSTSMPSESLVAPVSMPVPTSVASTQGFDADFVKSLGVAPTSMPTTTTNDFAETAAIAMPSSLDVPIDIDPWPVEQNLIPYSNMDTFDMSYNNNWF